MSSALPLVSWYLMNTVVFPLLPDSATNRLQGSTTGYIRFETPEQAKVALDNTDDGKVVICDCAAFVKFLEGEEELDFFKKVGETCVGQVLPPALPKVSPWRKSPAPDQCKFYGPCLLFPGRQS